MAATPLALTWPVLAAVLCGAVLHAGWNALIKRGSDKQLDTALVHVLGSALALPLLLITGLPQPAALPYIGLSALIHIGYFIALAGAYQHGELSLTYPIMRGAAPLLVALGSAPLIGESPSPLAWAGVLGVTAGVALVGLSRPAQALHHRKALAYALANAAIIACYTVVDGLGVRAELAAGGSAPRYVLLLFVANSVAYPLLVWRQRSPVARRQALAHVRGRWRLAMVGSAASIGNCKPS